MLFFKFDRGFLTLGLLTATLFLAGCSGVPYGITDDQWKSMSLVRMKELQENYVRIREERSQENIHQSRLRITKKTPSLEVQVEGGTVKMPPFDKSFAYKPAKLIVYQGHCQSVQLWQQQGDKKIALEICYLGDVLYVDPSKYEYQWRHGSLRFNYVPLWRAGFEYKSVTSQGYASLKNANIKIKTLVPPPPVLPEPTLKRKNLDN